MRPHFYTVSHVTEEACCAHCGWPLEVGDRAFMAADELPYCGPSCAREEARYRARRTLDPGAGTGDVCPGEHCHPGGPD